MKNNKEEIMRNSREHYSVPPKTPIKRSIIKNIKIHSTPFNPHKTGNVLKDLSSESINNLNEKEEVFESSFLYDCNIISFDKVLKYQKIESGYFERNFEVVKKIGFGDYSEVFLVRSKLKNEKTKILNCTKKLENEETKENSVFNTTYDQLDDLKRKKLVIKQKTNDSLEKEENNEIIYKEKLNNVFDCNNENKHTVDYIKGPIKSYNCIVKYNQFKTESCNHNTQNMHETSHNQGRKSPCDYFIVHDQDKKEFCDCNKANKQAIDLIKGRKLPYDCFFNHNQDKTESRNCFIAHDQNNTGSDNRKNASMHVIYNAQVQKLPCELNIDDNQNNTGSDNRKNTSMHVIYNAQGQQLPCDLNIDDNQNNTGSDNRKNAGMHVISNAQGQQLPCDLNIDDNQNNTGSDNRRNASMHVIYNAQGQKSPCELNIYDNQNNTGSDNPKNTSKHVISNTQGQKLPCELNIYDNQNNTGSDNRNNVNKEVISYTKDKKESRDCFIENAKNRYTPYDYVIDNTKCKAVSCNCDNLKNTNKSTHLNIYDVNALDGTPLIGDLYAQETSRNSKCVFHGSNTKGKSDMNVNNEYQMNLDLKDKCKVMEFMCSENEKKELEGSHNPITNKNSRNIDDSQLSCNKYLGVNEHDEENSFSLSKETLKDKNNLKRLFTASISDETNDYKRKMKSNDNLKTPHLIKQILPSFKYSRKSVNDNNEDFKSINAHMSFEDLDKNINIKENDKIEGPLINKEQERGIVKGCDCNLSGIINKSLDDGSYNIDFNPLYSQNNTQIHTENHEIKTIKDRGQSIDNIHFYSNNNEIEALKETKQPITITYQGKRMQLDFDNISVRGPCWLHHESMDSAGVTDFETTVRTIREDKIFTDEMKGNMTGLRVNNEYYSVDRLQFAKRIKLSDLKDKNETLNSQPSVKNDEITTFDYKKYESDNKTKCYGHISINKGRNDNQTNVKTTNATKCSSSSKEKQENTETAVATGFYRPSERKSEQCNLDNITVSDDFCLVYKEKIDEDNEKSNASTSIITNQERDKEQLAEDPSSQSLNLQNKSYKTDIKDAVECLFSLQNSKISKKIESVIATGAEMHKLCIEEDCFSSESKVSKKYFSPACNNAEDFAINSKDFPPPLSCIKVLRPYKGIQDRINKLKEVEVLFQLKNKENIVQIKEAWEENGILYIETEYCELSTVKELKNHINILKEGGCFLEVIKKFVFEVLNGLIELHKLNLIHSDLKPENIFIKFKDNNTGGLDSNDIIKQEEDVNSKASLESKEIINFYDEDFKKEIKNKGNIEPKEVITLDNQECVYTYTIGVKIQQNSKNNSFFSSVFNNSLEPLNIKHGRLNHSQFNNEKNIKTVESSILQTKTIEGEETLLLNKPKNNGNTDINEIYIHHRQNIFQGNKNTEKLPIKNDQIIINKKHTSQNKSKMEKTVRKSCNGPGKQTKNLFKPNVFYLHDRHLKENESIGNCKANDEHYRTVEEDLKPLKHSLKDISLNNSSQNTPFPKVIETRKNMYMDQNTQNEKDETDINPRNLEKENHIMNLKISKETEIQSNIFNCKDKGTIHQENRKICLEKEVGRNMSKCRGSINHDMHIDFKTMSNRNPLVNLENDDEEEVINQNKLSVNVFDRRIEKIECNETFFGDSFLKENKIYTFSEYTDHNKKKKGTNEISKSSDFSFLNDLNSFTFIIGDFNISRYETDPLEEDGDKIYMSPENLLNAGNHKSDIYSLGLILLELSTGIELPSSGSEWLKLRKNDFKNFNLHKNVNGRIIKTMLWKMLEKDWRKRSDATALLNLLKQAI